MNQSDYKAAAVGDSQADLIFAHLLTMAGEWVPMPELSRVSGAFAVHSRISDLRRRGHLIEQRSERGRRVVRSFYRLPIQSLGQ